MGPLIPALAAFASAALAAGVLATCTLAAGASPAQDAAPPSVLEACLPGEAVIEATDLPRGEGEAPARRVVDLESCPVGSRPIVDRLAGAALPPSGEGVHNEVLTADGTQQLGIEHRADGTIVVRHVGDEADHSLESGSLDEPEPEPFYRPPAGDAAGSTSPGQCVDGGLPEDRDERLDSALRWYFNRSTTPDYESYDLTPDAAEAEIRRAGANIAEARNSCGYADDVPVGLVYQGSTSAAPDVTFNGPCDGDLDGRSVVAFGNLSDNVLAAECTGFEVEEFAYDPIVESDIKLNRVAYRWTGAAPSTCRDRTPARYNLEAVVTHERGHTFGLGHTDGESRHKWLTMSPGINGPCQNSEATLGNGDVKGLSLKYRGSGGPAAR